MFKPMLYEIIDDLSENGITDAELTPEQHEQRIEDLKRLHDCLHENPDKFSAGDIVDWKDGLSNKKCRGPFIIDSVLSTPVIDNANGECGSPYFGESLDIVVMYISGQTGDFIALHMDSRRLKKV